MTVSDKLLERDRQRLWHPVTSDDDVAVICSGVLAAVAAATGARLPPG
jgi:hypothetical protein